MDGQDATVSKDGTLPSRSSTLAASSTTELLIQAGAVKDQKRPQVGVPDQEAKPRPSDVSVSMVDASLSTINPSGNSHDEDSTSSLEIPVQEDFPRVSTRDEQSAIAHLWSKPRKILVSTWLKRWLDSNLPCGYREGGGGEAPSSRSGFCDFQDAGK